MPPYFLLNRGKVYNYLLSGVKRYNEGDIACGNRLLTIC